MRRFELIRRQCWAASFGASLPYIRRHLRSFATVSEGLLNELRQIVPTFAEEVIRPLAEEPTPTDGDDSGLDVTSFSFPKQRALMKEVDEGALETALSAYHGNPAVQSWIRSSACAESGLGWSTLA
jgi:hypothetical protein